MEALFLFVAGAMNITCFVIGAKVGQQAQKGEAVKIPLPDPFKAVREHNVRKKADRERSRAETILRNIDSYDGTPHGQEDVPN